MSDKVKLPKEVAEAIKGQIADDWNVIQIMRQAVRCEMMTKQNKPICEFANSDSGLETLMSALVNGYEVEETPEDKVREMYYMLVPFGIGEEKRVLITQVLNAYGHKVKGVNS